METQAQAGDGYGPPPGGGFGQPPGGGFGQPPSGGFGQPPSGGYRQPGGYGPPTPRGPQTDQIAIVSFVMGCVALVLTVGLGCCCGPLGALGIAIGIAAIVLGVIAIKRIGSDPSGPPGKGLAIAGISLGGVTTALAILGIVLVLAGTLAPLLGRGIEGSPFAPPGGGGGRSGGGGFGGGAFGVDAGHTPSYDELRRDTMQRLGYTDMSDACDVSAEVVGAIPYDLPPLDRQNLLAQACSALVQACVARQPTDPRLSEYGRLQCNMPW